MSRNAMTKNCYITKNKRQKTKQKNRFFYFLFLFCFINDVLFFLSIRFLLTRKQFFASKNDLPLHTSLNLISQQRFLEIKRKFCSQTLGCKTIHKGTKIWTHALTLKYLSVNYIYVSSRFIRIKYISGCVCRRVKGYVLALVFKYVCWATVKANIQFFFRVRVSFNNINTSKYQIMHIKISWN